MPPFKSFGQKLFKKKWTGGRGTGRGGDKMDEVGGEADGVNEKGDRPSGLHMSIDICDQDSKIQCCHAFGG